MEVNGFEKKELISKIDFTINIQIFAEGEKTEDATPRKREEARKKGQVAKSQDLPQVTTLLIGVVIINMLIRFFLKSFLVRLEFGFSEIFKRDISIEYIGEVFMRNILLFAMVTGPVLLAVLVGGLLANYIQVGFIFTTEPLMPNFSKISPLNGIKNLFSLKKLVELIKTLIKLGIIAFYGYFIIKKNINSFMQIPYGGFVEGYGIVLKLGYDIVLRIAIALFIISVIDYFYQKWEFEKSLRMSKQEVREEFKQTEGDPQIKGRMRAMQREFARKRMLQDVPKATVVITNPTHISIAVQYEEGMVAPLVLAKGADNIAMRIREIAKENDIPLVENKPLARALYKAIEPGDEIPEEYYRAVAEILSFVFRQKQ